MALSLYIYYRVDGNILPIQQQANALLAEIQKKTEVEGRLLRRRDDAHTWMEIYEPISDIAAFSTVLRAAVCRQPLLAALQRHEEWFQPLA
ncbi:DUF4936 family protein [Vogesella amnigena]|uniref:DUF4936 family protein n=1 Tax=Vogesella amnigena TaxID=1507449 RepID=A0ABV7TQW9_9NEIS